MVVNDIIEQAGGRESKESERGNYLKNECQLSMAIMRCIRFSLVLIMC